MKLLEEMAGLVSHRLGVVKTLFSILQLETRLAGLSIFPLLINLCMLFVVMLTLWLSAMFLAGYAVASAFASPLSAICAVFILNVVLVLGLARYLMFNLKNMSFEKTRAYFTQKENPVDDKQEKKVERKNRATGKEITISTE
ncbi:MAG: hypothetical protein JJT82_10715 [Legionellaceae bacterium]|nr:hypothetical protein [Legionellaceae bacterium]